MRKSGAEKRIAAVMPMKKSPMPGKPQKIKKESEGYGDINK